MVTISEVSNNRYPRITNNTVPSDHTILPITIKAKIIVKIKIINMDGMRIYFDSLISKSMTIAISNRTGKATTNISLKSIKVIATTINNNKE